MQIVIGSDHFGFDLKAEIRHHLEQLGHEVIDLGCESRENEVDYPDVAEQLASRIARNEFQRGILVCGTGIGMAMAANKIPGVRAACAHDPYSAERARKSNDAQVLCLGSQVVGASLARILVDHWLNAEFAGGRSTRKVAKIRALDERYHRDAQEADAPSTR
jgi:ribose 5-phosphate isomerase B